MVAIHEEIAENIMLWDHFTRREEYCSDNLDKHGRFKFSNSVCKNIHQPIVSQYLMERGYVAEYPDNKSFAICLTHDVDDIVPPTSHTLASSLHYIKKMNLRNAVDQISWGLKKGPQSPYKNFKKIMELEEKYDAKSTFFFLTKSEDIRRPRYEIADVQDQLGQIIDRGWEVGLHVSYFAFSDQNQIQSERETLEKAINRNIIGCRIHYLRFQVPDTWEFLSRSGLKYDMTLGYPDAIGFRNGMCHPFKPYNLKTKSEIQIVEIPMAIMDTTLFKTQQSFNDATQLVHNLVNIVSKCHGVLVVNWHSNNFNSPFRESWLKVYENLLDYGKQKNAWLTSGNEIYSRLNFGKY